MKFLSNSFWKAVALWKNALGRIEKESAEDRMKRRFVVDYRRLRYLFLPTGQIQFGSAIHGILQMIGQKIAGLERVRDYVLFCQSDQFLMYQDWSVKNIAVFLVTSIAFSAIGMGAFRKKDL